MSLRFPDFEKELKKLSLESEDFSLDFDDMDEFSIDADDLQLDLDFDGLQLPDFDDLDDIFN